MLKYFTLLWVFVGPATGFAQTKYSPDSLDIMIGQMIMIGIGDFSEPNPREPIFEEIAAGRVGGVVLYEKNLAPTKTKEQLARLVGALQKNASTPLFVSIDEEGGWVTRMKTKYGFPKNVSAQYLGKLGELDSTRFYANQTASLLHKFGINMNYAPSVDVNINPENPVIGKIERSYSADADSVAMHAHAVIKAHQASNVVPVLKHFPGHGSSKRDTHLGLTDVTDTWQFEELFPYKALLDSGQVSAVMTAHIVNRALDETKRPATLSKKIVTGMLREFLGFKGVIISDDMQMGAIHQEYGLKEAIRMSIEAGVDVLMFANNVKGSDKVSTSTVHSIVRELVLDGSISVPRIRLSYGRIMELKQRAGLTDKDYHKTLKKNLKAIY